MNTEETSTKKLLKNEIEFMDKAIEILSKNAPEINFLNLSERMVFISHYMRFGMPVVETAEQKENKEHKELSELKEKHPDLWKVIIEKWVKFGEALKSNRTIKRLEMNGNQYPIADPKIFEAFWQGIASNTTIQELLYKDNCLGKQRFAFEPIPIKHFFSALESNQTIIYLNVGSNFLSDLSEPQWQEFSKVIENHPSIKILGLANNDLGAAEKRPLALQCLSSLFQKNKTLTTLGLAHNKLYQFEVFHPEKTWQNFCNAISQNKSLTYLDLKENQLKDMQSTAKTSKIGSALGDLALALGSHPTLSTLVLESNDFGELFKENWELLWKGLAPSSSLRKLKLYSNYIVKEYLLRTGGDVFREVVKYGSERLETILKVFQEHQTIFEIESEEYMFSYLRGTKMKLQVDTNRKEKHGTALTIAHCLYNIEIKNNKAHQKGFPKGIVSNILSFLMPQTLTRQVITEIETHMKKDKP